jgi:hypothetical protein
MAMDENLIRSICVLLGHCYLMTDDLQKAYTAYQQALYRLPNPKVRVTNFMNDFEGLG